VGSNYVTFCHTVVIILSSIFNRHFSKKIYILLCVNIGANMFWWGAGSDCSGVAPWGSSQPSSTSEVCPFGFFAGPRGSDVAAYEAANKLVTYLGDGKTDGEINEWSLYGLGKAKHPLHLHVHHMQIVDYECVSGSNDCTDAEMDEWIQVGEWRDVFPTFAGKVTTRFRVTDFPGETVLHCHFLRHEDLGMMDTVLVVDGYRYPPTPSPTAEVDTSQPTSRPIISPSVAPVATPTDAPSQLLSPPAAVPIPSPVPQPTSMPQISPTSMPLISPTPSPTLEKLIDTTVVGAAFANPTELGSTATLTFGPVRYVGPTAQFTTRGYNGKKP
jgi:hypothetical protein